MIRTNTNIALVVKHNRSEPDRCRSIIFERPAGFRFQAGDWIDISFDDLGAKGGKTYSLSSSPTESDLMITFKDGISDVKQRLAGLLPGDHVKITQYGNDYSFSLKPHQTSTLIAGGVGIAPFRSMLKEIIDTASSPQIELIYLNKSEQFLFEKELTTWVEHLPHVTLTKLVTAGLKRKDRRRILLSAIGPLQGNFYIAGPEAMVEDTEHLLIDHGVTIRDIKIDSFGGY